MRKAIKIVALTFLANAFVGKAISQAQFPKEESGIVKVQQTADKRIDELQMPRVAGGVNGKNLRKKASFFPKNTRNNTTVISVKGVDLTQLIELKKELLNCSIVSFCRPGIGAKRTFTLTVAHSGNTTDLVEKMSNKIANKYTFESFSDGAIALNLLKINLF